MNAQAITDEVLDLALFNPPHAIEGWLAGYDANGDAANAEKCRAALDLQATWRARRMLS